MSCDGRQSGPWARKDSLLSVTELVNRRRCAIIKSAMGSKFFLNEFPWNEHYRVTDCDDLITPALVVYPEVIAANIASTLKLLHGDADRWRAHIKTAKLAYTVRMLIERGVKNFKCATTLELLVACQNGAAALLLGFRVVGGRARGVRKIAEHFPAVRISVLAENEAQIRQWQGSRIGIFLDINPGMDRTGIDQEDQDQVLHLVRAVISAGLEFRGLHYYQG